MGSPDLEPSRYSTHNVQRPRPFPLRSAAQILNESLILNRPCGRLDFDRINVNNPLILVDTLATRPCSTSPTLVIPITRVETRCRWILGSAKPKERVGLSSQIQDTFVSVDMYLTSAE
jgi:hypothetical protein